MTDGDGSRRDAVILSSGAAKGAYALGVMRALFTGEAGGVEGRVDPDIFTGTSVGAYNAAIMSSAPGRPLLAALDRLEWLWRHRIANAPGGCGNGVFRLRGLPVQEIDLGCLERPFRAAAEVIEDYGVLATQGMERALRFARSRLPLPARLLETIDAAAFFDGRPVDRLIRSTLDLDDLARSRRRVAVATCRWSDGRARVFSKRQITGRFGFEPILASIAIPGLFPFVHIDGEPYVDGGLSMATPLKPAIRMGATHLHVIYLDPLLRDLEFPESANTLDVFTRVLAILMAENVNHDIRQARRINRGLSLLRAARRGRGRALDLKRKLGESDTVAALGALHEDIGAVEPPEERLRHLVIHRYRPEGDLGGGAELLNFSLRQIDCLIDRGYEETVRHDCAESGCVSGEFDVGDVLHERLGGKTTGRDQSGREGTEGTW